MGPKKHRYAAPATRPIADDSARFVKRSITVRPDVDTALREIAGNREYSQIANEAFVLYIQARGIEAIVRDVESSTGPITAAEKAEAERRLADARRRAEQRRKARR